MPAMTFAQFVPLLRKHRLCHVRGVTVRGSKIVARLLTWASKIAASAGWASDIYLFTISALKNEGYGYFYLRNCDRLIFNPSVINGSYSRLSESCHIYIHCQHSRGPNNFPPYAFSGYLYPGNCAHCHFSSCSWPHYGFHLRIFGFSNCRSGLCFCTPFLFDLRGDYNCIQ